jgi:hypothetical protein
MEKLLRTIRYVSVTLTVAATLLIGIGRAISNEGPNSDSLPTDNLTVGDRPNANSVFYQEAGSLPPIVPDSDAWPDSNLDYSCQSSSLHPTDGCFQLSSGNRAVNEAYKLAICETNENIDNGVWIAGNGWAQLWTRDTSFSVEQAAGLLRPDISFVSFEKCVEQWPIEEAFGVNKTVWFQDQCGHFG